MIEMENLMADNINKKKIEGILGKYEASIRRVYTNITKVEGNRTLKKSQRKAEIKDLIIKEVTKNVD